VSLPVDFPVVTTGDGQPVAESWRLVGFSDENTDHGRLHITTVIVGGTLRFDCYSDRARGAMVCQGAAAPGAEATLAEVGDSGISGTVWVLAARAQTFTVFLALATDQDLERRDDRISGLKLEDPAEEDFRDVWVEAMREFYIRIQSLYPPPAFVSDPLRFPGTGQTQTPGRLGLPEATSVALWHLTAEGTWELKGLENPTDWRTWAILYCLQVIWERKARSGDDGLLERAARYQEEAERAWERVPVMVDTDRNAVPERILQIRTMTLERG